MTTLSLWNDSPLFKNMLGKEWDSWVSETAFVPPCDVQELEHHFLISMDIPGLKKEEFNIEVNEDVLTISGERKTEKKKSERGYFRSERFAGKFRRDFALGEQVNVQKIEAGYEEGVLKVQIPREKPVKPEVIKIKVGERLPTEDTH